MPRKIDLITELYKRTVNNITSDSVAWRAFLTSAAYQYKYSFADQVLIHAQRPRATACAELELWNKHFDRWVKRGATGIALITGNPNGGKMYLNHVFDVADTHHREDKPFKLWSVSPSLEEDVVEALENRFGDLGNKDSFTDAVISTCINLGQDNLHDYLRELEYSTEGSFLEELDEDNLRYRLQLTVQASVAYTVLSRLGYDADVYVGAEAFDWVHEFNTPATVNILGNATGDIAELCLREIERTVKSIERTMQQENRIIDGSTEKGYNDGGKEPTEQNNGGNDNGNHLQNGERREAAESQPAQTDRLPDREVWTDEIEFYEEPSQRDLHDPSDRGQVERSSVRSGADSTEPAFGDYVPDGTEPWGDRGTESDRSNEVGSDDEQHQELGGGGNSGNSDIRISDEDDLYAYDGKGVDPKYLDTEISGELPPPSEETLILALRHGDYLHKSKLSIVSFLMTESDPQKKVDYVKKSYEMGLTGEFFRPGTEEHIGYHVEPKGLVIYEGNYLTHKTEAKFSWELVTDLIEALMKEGRYLDDVREGQQLSFMDVVEPTEKNEAPINNYGISQDVIDDFLRVGACSKESAERIYGFFHRNCNSLDDIVLFLKTEYANGLAGIIHNGSKYAASWDDTGIRIARGDTTRKESSIFLSWETVAARIDELVMQGQYLSAFDSERADKVYDDFVANRVANLYCGGDFGRIPDEYKSFAGKGVGFDEICDQAKEMYHDKAKLAAMCREIEANIQRLDEYPPRYKSNASYSAAFVSMLTRHYQDEVLEVAKGKENLLPPERFITQDAVDNFLISRDSSYTDTKLRKYSFFLRNKDNAERAKFLSKEYGIGGGGGQIYWSVDGKGLHLSYGIMDKDFLFKWGEVAKRIELLIREDRYLGEHEIADFDRFEKKYICDRIRHFYYGKSDAALCPFDRSFNADYEKVTQDLMRQIEDKEQLAEIISVMQNIYDALGTENPEYESNTEQLAEIKAFAEGKFNLFPNSPYRRRTAAKAETVVDSQEPEQVEKSPVNENFGDIEYNLMLGATVHIGKDEMEILSLSAEKVELFDGTLIPYELPTDVFMKRLRENPLNDVLLKEPKAIPTPDITEQKKEEPKKTRKRKDKEPTMESLAASIAETYERWNFYLNGGGSDPTWEDGGNMNLLRNHILYYRRQMEDICKDGNFPEIYYRELPPEMPPKYMALPDKIREDARRSLAIYKANPTYQWCQENLSRIPEKQLKKSTIPAIMGYVSGLERAIEEDRLVYMRIHRNPERYVESFDRCREQMEPILERVSQDELTDSIFNSLMNEDGQEEQKQQEQTDKFVIDDDFKRFMKEKLEDVGYLDGNIDNISEDDIDGLVYDLKPTFEGSAYDMSMGEADYDVWYDEFIEEVLEPYFVEFIKTRNAEKALAEAEEPITIGTEEVLEKYVPVVSKAIEKDIAYCNACGNSDFENAKTEGYAAIRRAVLDLGDMELLKAFSDNTDFRHELYGAVIADTYPRLYEQYRPMNQADVDRINAEARGNGEEVKPLTLFEKYEYLKENYPGCILAVRVGDFYEFFDESAKVASEQLGLTLTSRSFPDGNRYPMCGIPQHRKDEFFNKLIAADFRIACYDEDGEVLIEPAYLAEQYKEINVIDRFLSACKIEDIQFGFDHQVFSAKDSEGNTWTQKEFYDFLVNDVITLDTNKRLVSGYSIPDDVVAEIVSYATKYGVKIYTVVAEDRTDPTLERAKELISNFCEEEYGQAADFNDLGNIGIAYTTIGNDEIPIQVSVDLLEYNIERYLNGRPYETRHYSSLEKLIENELVNLNFDDLVWVDEEELERYRQEVMDVMTDEELDSLPISTVIDGKVVTFPNAEAMLEAMGTAPMPTMQEEQPKEKVPLPVYHAHPDIPDEQKHNYRITDDAIGMGGAKEKFRKNMDAINLLHNLEFENRLATPEEQAILAQYSGWGGLADAFDETKDNWHSEFTELYTTLTPEEYEAAKESTLTAFYTPPVVIKAMYRALENMGFKRGNVLEPSCGVGNFMGLVPEAMDAKMYGVELDSLSGRIARQLYQKNGITIDGYERTQFPDSFFDVAIGNIPFEDFKILDKRYDKHNFLIHDYFFAKTLDKVRPGGVIAFVTSSGTLDRENPSVRKYIGQRAEFLGAIRLPNNAFSGAGTRVVSDIIFLQKRDRIVEPEGDWLHLGKDENGIPMNQYFVDHPDMIMGEMAMGSGPYGPEPTCKAYDGEDLGELLDEAVTNIHAEIVEVEREENETEQEDKSIPADPTVKNFSFTLVDGKIYYRQNSRMNPVETSMTGENRIKGMIGIRDTVRELIDAQLEGASDYEIKSLQARLNAQYDAFTAKYGLINSRGNAAVFSDDNAYFLLCSLEILDDNKELKAKADMFTKRTINPEITIDHVDTATEALAVSIGERAMVDMDYMSELTGKSEQELFAELKGVIFLNPLYGYGQRIGEKQYLMADEYLSGNVREKLEWAKRSAELYPDDYTVNVEALERVQPVDLGASEIGVRLGSTWIPDEDVQAFVHELLGTPGYLRHRIIVKFVPQTAQWVITDKTRDYGNVKANNTYGTHRINAYEIIEDTLNLKDVRIFDYVDDGHGNKKAVLNKKETTIAQGKQEQIKAAFEEWIWKDPARRERLCRLYNDKFNSTRPREFDGSHIKFYGMNPEITLRKHQADAVARIMYGGNALLAHVVGAGKTFTMVAAAQESKRLGLCNKSMFVVPNHLIEQWASEYLQLYPSANILVATKKDFETKNRKKFCARIATGDYDAIIIGHSQFEKIPMSVERQIQTIESEIDTILQGMEEVKRERGDRVTIKQLAKAKKQLETKLKRLNDQTRKDNVVTFEELGVDRLFVDEAHFYKNLAAYSKMRNVAGISQVEAQKSSDLYMKCRYLDEMTGGKGCVFATGTPISNTMVELYTMQKYLQYEELRMRGLLHFDAWASTFGETVTAIELSPSGTGYRAKTRFAKFFNIPELMAMFKQVADIQTADMLNLPVPEAHFHVVKVEASEIQKELVQSFADRAERIHNRMVTSDEDNMLLVTNDGRKAALDQRLIDPLLGDFDGSKVNTCVRGIYEIWEKNADKKSAQLVFCDLSTPKNDGSFNVYDDIRSKLIAMGIPSEEIAFIHSADTDVKKKELFGKVRRGQVRVLLGSTFKMGAGTNVQERLIALHDLDVPWRPSDLEQRAGRIVRQGNTNSEVDLFRYVTEGTFDAYSYQLLESKQKFISQIMTSKSPVRSAEDVDETALSYAEIKALASGNPLIMEKMQLDTDVAKLKLQKADHLSQRYSLEDSLIKKFPKDIAEVEGTIRGLEGDIETAKVNTTPNEKGFSPMTIMGTVYTEKAEAGNAILELCSRINDPKPRPLGSYRGFNMEIGFDTAGREFFINLSGKLLHKVLLGKDAGGIITRIDNQIESLTKRKDVCLERLAELHKQVENAKIEIAKPFPREEELAEKSKRLAEVNSMLDMDKRENELVDGAEEQSEDEQEKKDRSVDDRDDR